MDTFVITFKNTTTGNVKRFTKTETFTHNIARIATEAEKTLKLKVTN